jgi:hypothetical protein
MVQRLTEQSRVGDAVEIYLSSDDEPEWQPGIVEMLQHPGVWVGTSDGRTWFVTNGRRIRPAVLPDTRPEAPTELPSP